MRRRARTQQVMIAAVMALVAANLFAGAKVAVATEGQSISSAIEGTTEAERLDATSLGGIPGKVNRTTTDLENQQELTAMAASSSLVIRDYIGIYDGQSHMISCEVSGPSSYTLYYSQDTSLNDSNYSTEGSTTPPSIKRTGRHAVYVYLLDRTGSYTNVAGSGYVVIKPNATVSNYYGTYDGSSHSPSIALLGGTSGGRVFYRSDAPFEYDITMITALNKIRVNADVGYDQNPPSRTNAGTSTAYYMIVPRDVTLEEIACINSYRLGNGNLNGCSVLTGTVQVQIAQCPITGCSTLISPTSYTYDGTVKSPTVTINHGSRTLASGSDYTITSPSGRINAGTYTYTINGINNYSDTTKVSFTITPRSIASATASSIANQTYTGSEIKPIPTITLGGKTLVNGTDYTLSYTNNLSVGTATVTVTGKGNYTGSVSTSFKILPRNISSATVSAIKDQSHTGSEVRPVPTITVDGKTLVNGTDFSLTYANNLKIGAASVTVTGRGNYTGSVSTTFRIRASWEGGSKLPVNATATYVVSDGAWVRLKDAKGNFVTENAVARLTAASSTQKVVTGKKAGTTTLYLRDSMGTVTSKKITVYSITSGSYEMQSALASNLVLDIQKKSTANSARMLVYTRNNGKNQRYQFKAQKDGTYGIMCVHSGKYVDVQGGGTNQGQAVIQYQWNGGLNQKWYITVDADNYVTFVNAKTKKMCFDIKGGKAKSGAYMIQWPSNNKANQKWVLNKK